MLLGKRFDLVGIGFGVEIQINSWMNPTIMIFI